MMSSFNFANFQQEFGDQNDSDPPSSPVADVPQNGHQNGSVNGSTHDNDDSESISQIDNNESQNSSVVLNGSQNGNNDDTDGEFRPESSSMAALDQEFALPEAVSPSPSLASSSSVLSHGSNNPKCNLKVLIDDGILLPATRCLRYLCMGKDFVADLLPNGYIRHCGTVSNAEFASPSLWVNHCRMSIPVNERLVGSVWALVRYNGKRLDSFKLRWYRKQKKPEQYSNGNGHQNVSLLQVPVSVSNIPRTIPNSRTSNGRTLPEDDISLGDQVLQTSGILDRDKDAISFSQIKPENWRTMNPTIRIRPDTFSSMHSLQPFHIQLRTNALLLIDFHTHLSTEQLSGYLAGRWSPQTNQLTIVHAFPLMLAPCKDDDNDRAVLEFERRREKCLNKIKRDMMANNLSLIGWYHSHPKCAPNPSVADIKEHMEHQKKMLIDNKGVLDYTPCVGLINSPSFAAPDSTESVYQLFWVMPHKYENLTNFGRPMQMSYDLVRDAFLTQELLIGMRHIASHYKTYKSLFDFTKNYSSTLTYREKLQQSLTNKLPMDLIDFQDDDGQIDVQMQALQHFWTFVCNLVSPQEMPAPETSPATGPSSSSAPHVSSTF